MSEPPVHVHVADNTPLHVHVKKPKKNDRSRNDSQRAQSASVVRHSVRPSPRGKSKSLGDPWIPAPARTSNKGDKLEKAYRWDSGRAQLEVNRPRTDSNINATDGETLRKSDLSTDEDNRLRGHISEYERKIECLMAEVGTLKNETRNLSDRVFEKSDDSLPSPRKSSNSKQTSTPASSRPATVVGSLFEGLPDPNAQEKERPGGYSFHSNCCAEWEQLKPSEERIKKALAKLIRTAEKGKKSNMMKADSGKDINLKFMENTSNPTLYFDKSHHMDFDNKHEGRGFKEDKPNSKVYFKQPLSEAQLQPHTDLQVEAAQVTRPSLIKDISNISYEEWKRSFNLNKSDSSLELKNVEDELEIKEEQLEASKMVLDDKQKELHYISKEFEETEKENYRLRKSLERYHDDLANSLNEVESQTQPDDALHRQLVEVEVCGTEAGKQVAALRDVLKRFQYEKRLTHADVNALNRQRELLLQRLDDFETSNRTVRRLLQKHHKTVSDVKRLEDQRDVLMKKMADADSDALRMRSELIQKKNNLEQLVEQVGEEKHHTRTLTELNKSVEATRAHLQRELRNKEMENNRLQVQLKNMERDTEEVQREAQGLTSTARAEREALAFEKESLKKAAKSQRSRAEKAEDALRESERLLTDREDKLQETRSQADAWKERYQRVFDEKANLEDEAQSLAAKVNESESKARSHETFLRNKEIEMKTQIERLAGENLRLRSELDRCISDAASAEERCRQAQHDASTLRSDSRQYEDIVSDLRSQLRKAKNEAEEALLTAEKVERNSRRIREDGVNELERVREQMLGRMKDLQPLPGLLKETEMKLQDAQDKIHMYEQRSADQTRRIADLTSKDDGISDQVSTLKQRIAAMNDENRALEARLQILHVKLDDRDARAKETVLSTVNKDEKIQQLQLKLEEQTHEKHSLKRQLEAALVDTRKAVESEASKATAMDHANQARIVDLETQITRLKSEIVNIKRTKEDTERRNQSKLQDARDRLEQAESTNRSMRNYVNFLKTSYNNVFGGDASLTSTPIRGERPASAHSPF